MPLSVFKVPYLARGPKQLPTLLTTVFEHGTHSALGNHTVDRDLAVRGCGKLHFLWSVGSKNGGK